MTSYGRLGLLIGVGWVGVALAAGPAGAAFVTTPPGDGVGGNGMGVDPFANVGDTDGNRYQQVYAAAFFAPVGQVQAVSAVAFRPKQGVFGAFIGGTLTLSDVTVRLSTTGRSADTDFPTGLSGDLATNPGADAVTVYSGPLTLTTTRSLFATGVAGFDYRIAFQTPFIYAPGRGNLLLEVTIPAGATVGSDGRNFPQLDSYTDGFPSRDGTASATDVDLTDGSTVGRNSTTGAVTQFTVTPVPAPAGLAVVAAAGLGLAAGRWRR